MNEENIELKVNENGKVVKVMTVTQTEEVLFSSKELKRQIDEHQAIIDKLLPQYQTVIAFEQDNDIKDEDEVSEDNTYIDPSENDMDSEE